MIVYSSFFLKFNQLITLFFLCLFLISFNFFSQEPRQLEFVGMLKIPDNSIITYKINFKEFTNGNIEGFSITDFYGTEKTKSKITGRIHPNKKSISFSESENLSTKSNASAGEFCFIHVENAKIKSKTNKTIIEGKFQGKYNNGKNCVDGYLYLVGTHFLSKPDSSITLIQKKTIDELLHKANKQELLPNETLKINWVSEEIILELSDSRKVDGDAISLFFNDKKILDNFIIDENKKIIKLSFSEKQSIIKIIATNEGTQAPNTVSVLLKDNSVTHPTITHLKTGETSTIILKKTVTE